MRLETRFYLIPELKFVSQLLTVMLIVLSWETISKLLKSQKYKNNTITMNTNLPLIKTLILKTKLIETFLTEPISKSDQKALKHQELFAREKLKGIQSTIDWDKKEVVPQ